MAGEHGFLEELKRRKVVRVAVVYLAVAWAVVQVADVFVPALGLPASLITTVAVLVILGLPIALGMAWAFEITPQGVKRAADAPATGPSRWVSVTTLVVAGVLLAGGFLAGRLVGGNGNGDLDRMAVAVLPFEARGADDDIGFADGVHDDILTHLSRIDALRVTSRTSVQAYRGTTKNVRTIAAELGVGTVLEGGVQRTADRVRINMQLIDGATDEHLWAETFDRELTAENVFAIQSDIARAVATALEATLTAGDESDLAAVPTRDLEALDLYHRGRRLYDAVGVEGSRQAITVLEQAVARDPEFARAWAQLTLARSWSIREGETGDTVPARQAMERTLELSPGSVDAALASGHYLYYARADYEGGLAAFREAASAQSGDADLTFAVANVVRRLARWDEATRLYEEVVRLEPRNARAAYELAWQYFMTRQYDLADSVYRRYRELAPETSEVLGLLAEVALVGRGDTAAAAAHVEEWERVATNDNPAVYRSQLAYFRRDPSALEMPLWQPVASVSFAQYWLYPDGPSNLWRARMAWVLGDRDRARSLATGLEASYVAATPALRPGSNVMPPDGDIFGMRATQYLLRAWELVFAGEPDRGREEGDRALSLHAVDSDGTDGSFFLRQRMLIRVVTGDADGAVEDLQQLLALPGLTTTWELRLDPIYDPLRGRADFQALLAAGV